MTLRHWLAAPIVVGAVGLVTTTTTDVATAGSNLRTPVRVAIVDEAGAPRPGATVMACPYRHGTADCDEPITAPTNRRGVGRLRLDAPLAVSVHRVRPRPGAAVGLSRVGDRRQPVLLRERPVLGMASPGPP